MPVTVFLLCPGCRPLREGDIINIDVTVFLNGYHGDTSRTFCVGTPSPSAKRLVEANEEALREAIKVSGGWGWVALSGSQHVIKRGLCHLALAGCRFAPHMARVMWR